MKTLQALGSMLMIIVAGCTRTAGVGPEPDLQGEAQPSGFAEGSHQDESASASESEGRASEGNFAPVAVVELFTSEGCSSCPPADEVLREFAKEANSQDSQVYLLSFHVDYWNELGWPDPMSSERNTTRQRRYARVFGTERVYTPQMVVSGTDEFVGSDRSQAKRSIEKALSHAASVKIRLRPVVGSGSIEAHYDIEGASAKAALTVALVESGVVSQVPRGENAGRTLRHENVVRDFQSVQVDTSKSGTVKLAVPPRVGQGQRALIGYVQGMNLTVLGATRVLLPDS